MSHVAFHVPLPASGLVKYQPSGITATRAYRPAVPVALRQNCVHQRRSDACGPVRASFVTSVAETATLAAAVGGIALSALPLLTGQAAEQNADRTVNAETSEDDFVFGVMSAVSFLPYVNWTAWVFKGLDGDDPGLYYALAAAYGLPWVFHDLRLDGFTALMLILGAIHVQIERIAATEPVRLEVPGISQLAAQAQKAIAKPVAAAAESARRKQLSTGQRRPLPGQDEQEDDLDKRLLDRWDDIFKTRDKERSG